MADRGHVDADLVGAPGLEPAGDQARRPERLLDPPVGDRVTAARLGARPPSSRGDARWRPMAASTLPAETSKPPQTSARYSRIKRAGAAVVGEKVGEALVGGVGLGDDEKPGRVLVEPMDDARAASRRRSPRGSLRNGGSAH